ncbi:ABC transporter ATP-binding protein [Bacillus piscicola]|uniref:ABC transporter ATP-binding protein n=1 Tax=Bacillus piscicola TaxID=1632684 RepID=UPI001F08F980|nr:ABC transporter ATP-binding protein [Bacillus piscicola]
MIELNQVGKRYLAKTALHDITLTLPQGGITGLIGENGSGKSTLLKILAGLVKPSTGTVFINEKKTERQIAADVAYLSELDTFYSFYKVKDMVDFQASQFPDFSRKRADDMLTFMKLDPNSKIKVLSKGNRGRLKIVLALAREAPVILMDEPLSGLDPMVRDSIVTSLISFVDVEKQTVLITTHEVNEMEPIFDRVVAIREGRLLGIADAEKIRGEQGMRVVDWLKEQYQL